jgi:hypothetical protein
MTAQRPRPSPDRCPHPRICWGPSALAVHEPGNLFEHLYGETMASEAVIERDWDLVASLAADLHDAHGRLVDLMAPRVGRGVVAGAGHPLAGALARGPGRPVAGTGRGRRAAGTSTGRPTRDGGSPPRRAHLAGPGCGGGPAHPGRVRRPGGRVRRARHGPPAPAHRGPLRLRPRTGSLRRGGRSSARRAGCGRPAGIGRAAVPDDGARRRRPLPAALRRPRRGRGARRGGAT